MENSPVPSKCNICFTACMLYPCCSQNSQVMVETWAPISMRAITQMSPTKISASFTLPINSMVTFGLRGGGLGVMLVGWGLALALAQVPLQPRCWMRFHCVSPSGSLRSGISGARELMSHMPPTLEIAALDLVLVASHWPEFDYFVCSTVLAVTLPLRSLAAGTGALTVPSLTLIGSLWEF